MKNIFRANLFSLSLVLLQILSAFIIGIMGIFYSLTTTQALLITDIIALILPITIYLIITKLPLRQTLRLKKLGIKEFLLSILIGFLFIPIGSFLGMITSFFFENNVVDVMDKLSTTSNISFFLIIALMPAVLEELTVRGIILSGYNKLSIHKSAIITGLIFAMFHLNPPQFLYTFVLGILLAYLVYYTESIFSSMIVHFIFNGLNALVFIISKYNGEQLANQEVAASSVITAPYILGSLFTALCCTTIIILIFITLKRDHKQSISSNLLEINNNEIITQTKEPSAISAYLPLIILTIIFILFCSLTFII